MVLALELFEQRNCATCTARNKVSWGCEADVTHPIVFDDDTFARCVRRPLLDEPEYYSHVFWAHRNHERGILQEEGGLQSQPHRLMHLFRLIDHFKGLAAEERYRRSKK